MLVLDASIALTWCFEDEASVETDLIFESIQQSGASIPALWHLEITNILVMAEKEGRLSSAQSHYFLNLIESLGLTVVTLSPEIICGEVCELARNHGLTTYDAIYLVLAMRLGVPLATKDKALRTVATRLGTEVLPT
jgi:predicted nucleic acid-binding protein